MSGRQAAEAVIYLDASGRHVDANEAALDLLGVSSAELRASPPDRFIMQPMIETERHELRSQWEARGHRPLVGTAGLRRADGTLIRVAYAVEFADAGFHVRLRQVEGEPHGAPTVFTVDDVLREWRAAERELAELAPGTPEWERVEQEITLLRSQYQEFFRDVDLGSGD